MANQDEIRTAFRADMHRFVDDSMAIGMRTEKGDTEYYFMSPTGQLYAYETKKRLFFEPTGTKKIEIMNDALKLFFTDDVKTACKEKSGVEFKQLVELKLRKSYQEKHIGRKFFYHEQRHVVLVWSLTGNKWEEGECDKLKYLFSNNDIITDKEERMVTPTKVSSFAEFGIDMDDLEELKVRYKDDSIHYHHSDQEKIYSLNIKTGVWYIPVDTVQARILQHIKDETKN
jgi:hypothetical protein